LANSIMFELTNTPIDPAALRIRLDAAETGALTIFEGRVRNHHLGRPVTKLEYEAFDDMARLEGEAITSETEALYPGARVLCAHRTGTLGIGDIAVWIGVASAHRAAGFAACRHVIEEIKRRLPVWKKEHHPDGAAEWVNCSADSGAMILAEEYYARQAALPEVGPAGQAKLAAARVLVVGIGGLGCPAALYLAGAGIGRLTLVDGGKVELSNLHRQILFTPAEVDAPKALAGAARLRAHNPGIEVVAHDGHFTPANAVALVAGQSLVLDCTDNFATRFLVHDACRAAGVPLVSAAVHRFEGELNVFAPGAVGCIHCQWSGLGPDALDRVGSCAAGPVFAPAVGVLGLQQAAEALKLLLGIGEVALNRTRLINLLDGTTLGIERAANPACPVCGTPAAGGAPAARPDAVVLLTDEQLAANGVTRVVALLEDGEPFRPEAWPAGTQAVPIHDLVRLRALAATGPIALTCRSGLRSAAIARLLRAEGLAAVYGLVRQ
jgi:molybdopterin/thiamine biosynthesis adenylyltransferase/molybdopterin synthase catalytic subunit/rhodanese-related sulfurtransferase